MGDQSHSSASCGGIFEALQSGRLIGTTGPMLDAIALGVGLGLVVSAIIFIGIGVKVWWDMR